MFCNQAINKGNMIILKILGIKEIFIIKLKIDLHRITLTQKRQNDVIYVPFYYRT